MEEDVDLPAVEHGTKVVRVSKGVLYLDKERMVFLGLAEEENVTFKRCIYVQVGNQEGGRRRR